jgi:hypothetical protein
MTDVETWWFLILTSVILWSMTRFLKPDTTDWIDSFDNKTDWPYLVYLTDRSSVMERRQQLSEVLALSENGF